MYPIPITPVLLCWALAVACNAQAPPVEEVAATDREIHYDHVRCGLMDRHGTLWFGTTGDGVFRYDGARFHNLTTADGLINDTVYTLLEARNGDLWIGTINGVSRYDGGHFTDIPIPTNTTVDYAIGPPDPAGATRMVTSLLEDRSGDLWFGTNGGGVYRYHAGELHNTARKQGLFDVVESMVQDSTGAMWFCSWDNGGVARYDGTTFTHYGLEQGLGDLMVFHVMQDLAGDLWFSLRDNGVSRYDGNSFTTINKAGGLWSNNITRVVQARDGSYWFTSARNGVCRFDGSAYHPLTTADGLCHNSVWFGVEDRDGRLWFGTRNGGLCRWNGKTFEDLSGKLAEAVRAR